MPKPNNAPILPKMGDNAKRSRIAGLVKKNAQRVGRRVSLLLEKESAVLLKEIDPAMGGGKEKGGMKWIIVYWAKVVSTTR